MAGNALADRREGVSGELFEDVVEAVNRFLRESPRDRWIRARCAPDTIDLEEEGGARPDGLHEDRRRSRNQRRRSEQIPRPHVSHGDLATVAGMHVDAKQALDDDGKRFGLRFGIHGLAGRELDDPSAIEQRLDCFCRQGRPTSALQHAEDVTGCGLLRQHWLRAVDELRRAARGDPPFNMILGSLIFSLNLAL